MDCRTIDSHRIRMSSECPVVTRDNANGDSRVMTPRESHRVIRPPRDGFQGFSDGMNQEIVISSGLRGSP